MSSASHSSGSYTAFVGPQRIASGPLDEVALAVAHAQDPQGPMPLVFSDATGKQVELDLRGGDDAVRQRYQAEAPAVAQQPARGRGRPKLGVLAREVTLLPEHWDWLAGQPGGASVALRKLVHEARRAGGHRDRARRAHERAYHVMSSLAGDLPGFEEAGRALFAGDRERLALLMAPWPTDIREHVARLADPDFDPVPVP